MIKKILFETPWWLPSGHLQTIVPTFLPKASVASFYRQIYNLPDSDILELVWTEKPHENLEKPIVLVLHGLEGSIHSHYAVNIMHTLKHKGFVGVLMHYRNCGKLANKTKFGYHAGEITDLSNILQYLNTRYPNTPISAIDFSIGANMLMNYLGKTRSTVLSSCVMVCPPLDLDICADKVNRGFSKIYQYRLLRQLKKQTLKKIKRGLLTHINENELLKIKSIREFDDKVTAVIYHFAGVDDYYHKCSGKQFLKNIAVPSLVIHANNDPFITKAVIPTENELSPQVTFEISPHGGHVGFITGKNPFKPKHWLNKRILEFINNH